MSHDLSNIRKKLLTFVKKAASWRRKRSNEDKGDNTGLDFVQLLPPELVVNIIFTRLDFTSRISAAAVSHSWRDLSLAAPPVTGMPHLWQTFHEYDLLSLKETHHLVDLSSSTTRRSFSKTPSDEFCYATRGPFLAIAARTFHELTTHDLPRYSIFNPFTGENFQLPGTVLDREKESRQPLNWVKTIQISSKPPNCLVVAGKAERATTKLYICRLGQHDWVEGPIISPSVLDMIFYAGQLCCIDGERVVAYDIQYKQDQINGDNFSLAPRWDVVLLHRNSSDPCKIGGYNCKVKYYLVESNGELMVVTRFETEKNVAGYYETVFSLHRVDRENRRLVNVDDLGDLMLFVGKGCSQSCLHGTKPTSKFFEKNCIYFITYFYSHLSYRLGKFKLTDFSTSYYSKFRSFANITKHPTFVTPIYPR